MFKWAIYSIYHDANPYWKTNLPPSEELKNYKQSEQLSQPNQTDCVLIKFVTHSLSIKRTAGISVRWNCLRWPPLCRLSFTVNSLWKPRRAFNDPDVLACNIQNANKNITSHHPAMFSCSPQVFLKEMLLFSGMKLINVRYGLRLVLLHQRREHATATAFGGITDL